jgi:hypothetical protein
LERQVKELSQEIKRVEGRLALANQTVIQLNQRVSEGLEREAALKAVQDQMIKVFKAHNE